MKKLYSCFLLFTIFLMWRGELRAQTADFTYSTFPANASYCDSVIIIFDDVSTGATSWLWEFGPNAIPPTSNQQNPGLVIFPCGSYNVKLTVNGGSVPPKIVPLVVNCKPTACFTASALKGCTPLSVQYNSSCSSSSGPLTYLWGFCDGDTSHKANPSHVYLPGCYCTKLFITDNKGCTNKVEKPLNYICSYEKPAFTINPVNSVSSCTAPLTVSFNSTVTAGTPPYTYNWSFPGSGVTPSTSASATPSVTFNSAGSFSVSCTFTDASGCSVTASLSNIINVGNYSTSFTASSSLICECQSVQFVNPDTDLTHTHHWSVTPMNSGVSPSPPFTGSTQNITFCTPGTYTITDTVGIVGCKLFHSKTVVVNSKPDANFKILGDSNFCAPNQTIKVQYLGIPNSSDTYQWNFGGGAASGSLSAIDPGAITFNTCGTYSVSLTVTRQNCSVTKTFSNVIKINCPQIQYTNTDPPLEGKSCAPLTLTFNRTLSTGAPPLSCKWIITPVGPPPGTPVTYNTCQITHTFTTPGCYDMELTGTYAGGCTATYKGTPVCVGQKVTPCFDATPKEVCAKEPITFTNCSTPLIQNPPPPHYPPGTTWCWNFGDESPNICQSAALEPIYFFQDTGKKDIRLIVRNNMCYDTLIKEKFVNILPPISVITTSLTCDSPACRLFKGTKSKGAVTYQWEFPSGTPTTYSDSVVKVCWPLPVSNVSYLVKLTTFNKGCSNTTTQQILIRNLKVNFKLSDSTGCAPLLVNFTNLSTGYLSLTTSVSRINPPPAEIACISTIGFPPLQNPPPCTITKPGVYRVEMIGRDVNGCRDTMVKFITVYGTYPGFAPTPKQGCAPLDVTFNNTTLTAPQFTAQPVNYLWKFGDGTTSILKDPPVHTYNQGKWDVTLIVTEGHGCKDSTVYKSIIASDSKVKFQVPDSTICLGAPACFTDSATGTGLTYLWDFGDGTPKSTAKNPCHTYAQMGTYSVTLTVSDAIGCVGTSTRKDYIIVGRVGARFTVTDSIANCPDLFITFNDQTDINNACAFRKWEFGDGSVSYYNPNPFHAYTYSGQFSVRLMVCDTCLSCCDTIVKQNYINVGGPYSNPKAEPDTGSAPLTVNFDLTPTNSVSFLWDFGDGMPLVSGGSTISHTYTDTGVYIAKVVLTDGGIPPCTYTRIVDTIYVVEVHAKFLAPDSVCTYEKVSFIDSSYSRVGVHKWYWDFGDGGTSALKNPTHVYTSSGDFNVKLIAYASAYASDTFSKIIHVSATPVAGIISSDSSVCPNVLIQYTDNSSSIDPIASRRWKFTDGYSSGVPSISHIYSKAGIYADSLFITTIFGCVDTAIMQTIVNPFPVANAGSDHPVCLGTPDTLFGSGGVLYQWQPANSLNDSSLQFPVASPTINTTYTLTVTDINGCTGDTTLAVTINIPPHASVIGSPRTICFGSTAMLTASGGVTYLWYPGGATNATFEASPADNTTYTVTAYDINGCGDDTTIAIIVLPPPPADAGKNREICFGDTVHLKATGGGSEGKYNWRPKNYSLPVSNIFNPVASPTVTTTYSVTVTDAKGCSALDIVTVKVNKLPPVNAGADVKICTGSSKMLSASGAVSYIWKPDSFIVNSSTVNPLVFPPDTVVYTVFGTDDKGCTGEDSLTVEVLLPFTVSYPANACVCPGESVTLHAQGSTVNTYKWKPLTGLSADDSCCPEVSPMVNTTYTVIVSDEFICFADTGYVSVCVHPHPEVEAGKDEFVLAGSAVKLYAQNVKNPGTGAFNWAPDSTLNCYNCQNPIANPIATTTYYVTLTDIFGCRDEDKVVVNIFCSEEVLYIPNAFTPNGDGINEKFIIQGEGISQFVLKIFNRWGERVFETNNLKQGWDGTVKGKKSEPEVFVYLLEATCSTGESIVKQGNITLIR